MLVLDSYAAVATLALSISPYSFSPCVGTHAENQRRKRDFINTPQTLGTGALLMATQKLPSEARDTPSGRPGRLSRKMSRDPAYNATQPLWFRQDLKFETGAGLPAKGHGH